MRVKNTVTLYREHPAHCADSMAAGFHAAGFKATVKHTDTESVVTWGDDDGKWQRVAFVGGRGEGCAGNIGGDGRAATA